MKCIFDGCNNDIGLINSCGRHGEVFVSVCKEPTCFKASVRNGLCEDHQSMFPKAENVSNRIGDMDSKTRKLHPVARGVLDYFPNAIMAVANVSYVGNEQHNPGQPMHWAKEKSTDHADCIVRHLIQRGTLDTDGLRHSAKIAWRALALLETEIEAEGK